MKFNTVCLTSETLVGSSITFMSSSVFAGRPAAFATRGDTILKTILSQCCKFFAEQDYLSQFEHMQFVAPQGRNSLDRKKQQRLTPYRKACISL